MRALYHDVLGREAEASGLAYWLGAMNAGADRNFAASVFLHSTESLTRIINAFYTQFLRRPGESTGVEYWVNQLRTGAMTVSQAVTVFLASDEFWALTAKTVK